MPRLLLIVPTLSSYEAFLSDFAEAAVLKGYEVHVATHLKLLDGREPEESSIHSSAVHFHSLKIPRAADLIAILRASRGLRSLVQQIRPDWVQAHFSIAALVLAVAKQSHWPYTSCIIQGLSSTLNRGLRRVLSWFGERYAISKLDEMWVLTQDDYEVVSAWEPSKARLQEALGFGCRLEHFDPNQYSADWCNERKSKLSLAEEAFTIIFVGRLVAFKGFDLVARLYWELKSRGCDVQLILLGAFDELHASGLSDTEVQKLKIDSSVLLPGWKACVAEWLALADICVFPSEREGMPVCLMESLALGVPVLTANSRGCRDVVRDGIDGIVRKDLSVASLADQVEKLMMDLPRLESFRLSCLEGRGRFDRKHFVSEQLSELEAVLTQGY